MSPAQPSGAGARAWLGHGLGSSLLVLGCLVGLADAWVCAAEAKIRQISFDDIKFEMPKGAAFQRALLTESIERLNGTSIRIRGYILPSFQQTGITQFVLVRDNLECCFGPGAALYDCILVELAPGKSTSYTVRPVAVEGTFSIRPLLGPDGKHLAIYRLEGRAVK